MPTMIHVTYDGKTLEQVDESTLRKRTIIDEDENEMSMTREYRPYGSEQVIHRSTHVVLRKMPVSAEATAAAL